MLPSANAHGAAVGQEHLNLSTGDIPRQGGLSSCTGKEKDLASRIWTEDYKVFLCR